MENNDGQNKKQVVPTASVILDDGTIVEMIFRPDLRRTLFAIYSAGRWTLQDAVDLGPDAKLVPFSANNNLIKGRPSNLFRSSLGRGMPAVCDCKAYAAGSGRINIL